MGPRMNRPTQKNRTPLRYLSVAMIPAVTAHATHHRAAAMSKNVSITSIIPAEDYCATATPPCGGCLSLLPVPSCCREHRNTARFNVPLRMDGCCRGRVCQPPRQYFLAGPAGECFLPDRPRSHLVVTQPAPYGGAQQAPGEQQRTQQQGHHNPHQHHIVTHGRRR